MKAIFYTSNAGHISTIYTNEQKTIIRSTAELTDEVYTKKDLLSAPEKFADVDFIFSTWGLEPLTEEEIRTCLPKLKAVFYGAGTVQYFAWPFLACGVKVFSAWKANAIPVAEYTTAQIVLANKGFFRAARIGSPEDYTAIRGDRRPYPGNYDATVGLISYGAIASQVAARLRAYHLNVQIYSWSLTAPDVLRDGYKLVSLEELFETSDVISNHLANNEKTIGMIGYDLLRRMKPCATFLNTGRGRQVVEEDLIRVLRERPDITAVLDVTNPEPPLQDSPLYQLGNCMLTPHIAGSLGNEVRRMGLYMAEEMKRFTDGEASLYEVTEELLKTMA